MSLASSLAKLSFCRRISRTPGTFLRLVWQTQAANRLTNPPSGTDKTKELEYALNLANKPNTTALRTHAGDLTILYKIFWQHTYALPQLRAGAFRTVVDVGANVGLAALFFLERFPITRLICLESEPANFQLLQRNLRGTPAVAVQAALSATDGMMKIDSSPEAYHAEGTTEVAAISMPTLLQSQQLTWVDLLKIDLKGHEQQIFAKPADWLAHVGMLLIEIHSAASQLAVRQAVRAQGFSWEQADGKHTGMGLFVARNNRLISN